MAQSEGLRIGKASLGAVSAILVTILGLATTQAMGLSSRIGDLERQVTAIQSTHDAESKSTQRQLSDIKSIVEKIRDKMDQ